MRQNQADLRAAYRRIARQIHPDLAGDSVERDPRTILMARANRAWEAGSLAALEDVEREWQRLNAAFATVFNRCATTAVGCPDQARWLDDLLDQARRAYESADGAALEGLAAIDVAAALARLGDPRAADRPADGGIAAPGPGRVRPVVTVGPPPIRVGDRVLHWKFGSGVVLDRQERWEGAGQALTFVVRFKDPHGVKRLRQEFAGLERL